MTTTMELSTSESEGVNDTVRGFEFINLNNLAEKKNSYRKTRFYCLYMFIKKSGQGTSKISRED